MDDMQKLADQHDHDFTGVISKYSKVNTTMEAMKIDISKHSKDMNPMTQITAHTK